MNQFISILDSYAYRTLVWDIYVERVARPASGEASDVQKIAEALPKAEICLSALAELMGDSVARRSRDHLGRPPCRADRLGCFA